MADRTPAAIIFISSPDHFNNDNKRFIDFGNHNILHISTFVCYFANS